jgi:hypothetical protein
MLFLFLAVVVTMPGAHFFLCGFAGFGIATACMIADGAIEKAFLS